MVHRVHQYRQGLVNRNDGLDLVRAFEKRVREVSDYQMWFAGNWRPMRVIVGLSPR